MKEVVLVLL